MFILRKFYYYIYTEPDIQSGESELDRSGSTALLKTESLPSSYYTNYTIVLMNTEPDIESGEYELDRETESVDEY